MMDFAAQPPEIISGLLYAGPGPESLLAAATAWDALATELASAATSYGSVISGLTDESWTGPSAATMASAATPLVNWMAGAAGQAKQAAVQAQAAAGAYETAFAAVVAPPVIAANRTLRAELLATNTFGQNTAAIVAAEARYAQMWAQDTAAMYGYAAAAAAAARLTPFTAPAPATKPAGPIPNLLEQLASATTQATRGLGKVLDGGTGLSTQFSNLYNIFGAVMKFDGVGNVVMSAPNMGMVQFKTFFKPLSVLPEIPKSALGAGLGGPSAGGLVRAVGVEVGGAPAVGALSVPQGWATATPAIRLAAASAPTLSAAAAPAAADLAGALNPAALGSLTGGALGTPGSRLINASGGRGGPVGRGRPAPVQLDKVIAQLQKQKDAVQHWQIDEAGLDELLEELSKKPGFHAVHVAKGTAARPVAAAGGLEVKGTP